MINTEKIIKLQTNENGKLFIVGPYKYIQHINPNKNYLRKDYKTNSFTIETINKFDVLILGMENFKDNKTYIVQSCNSNELVLKQIAYTWIKTVLEYKENWKINLPKDNYVIHSVVSNKISTMSDEEILATSKRTTYPKLRKLDGNIKEEVLLNNPLCFSSKYFFNLKDMDNTQVKRIDAIIGNISKTKEEKLLSNYKVNIQLLNDIVKEFNIRNKTYLNYLGMDKYYDAGWESTNTYNSHRVYPKELSFNKTNNTRLWMSYLLNKFQSKTKENFFNKIESYWTFNFEEYELSSKRYNENKAWSCAIVTKTKKQLKTTSQKLTQATYFNSSSFNWDNTKLFELSGINQEA